MSLPDPNIVANDTFTEQEPVPNRLSPGTIAVIIICSTFLFYMTLMFIVCAGEYWQYINGKKGQKATERQQRVNQAIAESRAAKSNTNPGIRKAMPGSRSVNSPSSPSVEPVSKPDDIQLEIPSMTEELALSQQDLEMDYIEEDDDDDDDDDDNILNDTQDEVFVDCEQDISMFPLISAPCESNSVGDGSEILCDLSDSKDIYRLEADV